MGIVQEYDIIASTDIQNIDETFRFRALKKNTMRVSKTTSDGVIQIQNGFLNLLKDFILILPDSAIQEVTVQILNILYNNHVDFCRF